MMLFLDIVITILTVAWLIVEIIDTYSLIKQKDHIRELTRGTILIIVCMLVCLLTLKSYSQRQTIDELKAQLEVYENEKP